MGKGKKEKHKAKIAKREMLQRQPTLKANLVPILKPAFENMIERHEEMIMPYKVSLTRLRIGRGDGDDINVVFMRLFFGRYLAYKYFTEDVAAQMHQAVVHLCHIADTSLESDHMRIYAPDMPIIDNAFDAIEGMVKKIDREDYIDSSYEAILVHDQLPDGPFSNFIVTWDEFKLHNPVPKRKIRK